MIRIDFKGNEAKQLEMNKITYARLLSLGLKNGSDIELDFSFVAPNEAQGLKLAESLKHNGGFKIETGYSEGIFVIQGTAWKSKISLEIINQWVLVMCALGQEHECLFDGWGASL